MLNEWTLPYKAFHSSWKEWGRSTCTDMERTPIYMYYKEEGPSAEWYLQYDISLKNKTKMSIYVWYIYVCVYTHIYTYIFFCIWI